MATKARVTPEAVSIMLEAHEKTKERANELIKKKIDPVYSELVGRYVELTGQSWANDSKYLPWILEKLMNPQQAKICIALPDPHRDSAWGREHLGITEQFAKDVGLDREMADTYLQELMEKMVVNPTRNGYQLLAGKDVLLISDTHNNHKFPELFTDDYLDLMEAFFEEEIWKARMVRLDAGERNFGMAVMPRWKAIKDIPGVLPAEDRREALKANKKFAVLPCQCKLRARERECGTPVDVCFMVGKAAEYHLKRGAARELTRKEAFEFFEEMGKYPLVEVGMLVGEDPKQAGGGCFCHWDCCEAFRPLLFADSRYTFQDFMRPNRFRATVDPENCIGCGRCVEERCQFGAAQMRFYPEFGEERAYIDENMCMGCGCCVETCLVGTRSMKVVEPTEYHTEYVRERMQ